MPMSQEDYENLIAELNNPELDLVRKTDILQTLRSDYAAVHKDVEELSQTKEKLEKEKASLVESNSMLFRQAGYFKKEEQKNNVDEKTFSETIRVEDFEKRMGVMNNG